MIKKILQKKILAGTIGGLILIIIIIIVATGSNGAKAEIFQVQKTAVIESISVAGKVQSAETVDLAFEKSGRIGQVYADVGDRVFIGQTIVRLENGDILADLDQAKAKVKIEQSKLAELLRGDRPEEIKIKETELAKAKQDLENEYSNISDELNDAYINADDALRNLTNQFFQSYDNSNLTFSTDNSQLEIDTENKRARAISESLLWKNEIADLNSKPNLVNDHNELERLLIKAKNHLSVIKDSTDKTAEAVDRSLGLSSATLETYKTNANTARTNVNSSLSNINNQEQALSTQKITVQKIQNELDLKKAGGDPQEISAQKAQVESAEASARNFEAQLGKTVIRAPLNGIITKQEAKVGQIANPNTTITSMIGDSKFEIEASIPEVDVAKLKVGNTAQVTLDAYGAEIIFEASVTKIDPAETVIDGVSTYKTTLQFKIKDERVRSGMTANIEIETNRKENILAVPIRALEIKDGKSTVNLLNAQNNIKPVEVKTGLRGSNSLIEILSGLSENDRISISAK